MAPVQIQYMLAVIATAQYYETRRDNTMCAVVRRRTEAATSYVQFQELVLGLASTEHVASELPEVLLALLQDAPPEQVDATA